MAPLPDPLSLTDARWPVYKLRLPGGTTRWQLPVAVAAAHPSLSPRGLLQASRVAPCLVVILLLRVIEGDRAWRRLTKPWLSLLPRSVLIQLLFFSLCDGDNDFLVPYSVRGASLLSLQVWAFVNLLPC